MSNKKIILGVALFLLIGGSVALAYQAGRQGAGGDTTAIPAPVMPEKITNAFAAQFRAVRVPDSPMTLPDIKIKNPEGRDISLDTYAGKPLLINFWGTWCPPCIVELPSLQRFRDHYKGDLTVIGIAVEPQKTHAEVKDFLKKRELDDFAAYMDDGGRMAGALRAVGLPTSFLIGSKGEILYVFEGEADWASPATKEFFDVFVLQNR